MVGQECLRAYTGLMLQPWTTHCYFGASAAAEEKESGEGRRLKLCFSGASFVPGYTQVPLHLRPISTVFFFLFFQPIENAHRCRRPMFLAGQSIAPVALFSSRANRKESKL